MQKDQLVLHFETAPDRYPDTAIAARALLDWVDLVQAAVRAVSPEERLLISIVGVREGSSRFPQLLTWLDEQTGIVKSAWAEYPHLKSVVAGSAHTFWTAAVATTLTLAAQPKEQVVRLSDKDRALLAPMEAKVAASPAVKTASQRFYRTVEADPNITGVGVADSWTARPNVIVPRSEFPERGGLWNLQEDLPAQRQQHAIWDVVLLRPALVGKPLPWQFVRDGFKFSAQMADAHFLLAIREGRVPLNMQEGVTMRVEVEYQEALVGQVWEAVPRSRRIVRVLQPMPRS